MDALITGLIPPQNFEVIRDTIGAILGVELANQRNLNNAYPNVEKVWIERCIPFDSDTELPTVNLCLDRGEYSTRNAVKADGEYRFNIDIYTNAPTSIANGHGDQYAMVQMQKIVGMVRAILSNPVYRILTLEAGIIQRAYVDRFFVGDKSTVKDALSSVVGRLQFLVQAVETQDIYTTGVRLRENFTHVLLNESTEGFYYDFKPSGGTYITRAGEAYINRSNEPYTNNNGGSLL